MTTLLANINRYRQPFIPVVFNGFHLTPAYCDILAESIRDIGFAGGGAALPGMIQHITCNILEHGKRIGEMWRRFGILIHGGASRK